MFCLHRQTPVTIDTIHGRHKSINTVASLRSFISLLLYSHFFLALTLNTYLILRAYKYAHSLVAHKVALVTKCFPFFRCRSFLLNYFSLCFNFPFLFFLLLRVCHNKGNSSSKWLSVDIEYQNDTKISSPWIKEMLCIFFAFLLFIVRFFFFFNAFSWKSCTKKRKIEWIIIVWECVQNVSRMPLCGPIRITFTKCVNVTAFDSMQSLLVFFPCSFAMCHLHNLLNLKGAFVFLLIEKRKEELTHTYTHILTVLPYRSLSMF